MLPPTSVLAAVDFSEGSRAALSLAARLAVHCSARLHVLHAEDPLLGAAASHQGIDLERQTRDELHRFVAAAWPASIASPQLDVAAGPAHDVVLDAAHRHHADVVVVGSRGMSGASRFVFGSTAENVLRAADVSVLVVPPGWTLDGTAPDLTGVGPLVAGLDLSPASARAAAAAAWLAATLHTWLEVVHVVGAAPVLERWRAHADEALQHRMDVARNEVARIVKGLAGTVPVETRVETGDVAERLAAVATADPQRRPLMVLGRREGGRRGAAPGAIAYRTLMISSVPVLVYQDSAPAVPG
jgi:nucleotide-binding universal stress UspA family protein